MQGVRATGVTLALAASLGACGGAPDKASAPPAPQLEAGQWLITSQVEQFAMPEAPPALVEAQRATITKPVTASVCITPEQARQPTSKMFSDALSKNCPFDRFSFAGGRIAATLDCPTRDGGRMTASLAGDYRRTDFTMLATMNATNPRVPNANLQMIARTTAKRVGACKA